MPESYQRLKSTVSEEQYEDAVAFLDDFVREQSWRVHTLPGSTDIMVVETTLSDGFVDVDDLYSDVCNPPLHASPSGTAAALVDAAEASLTFSAPAFTRDVAEQAVNADYLPMEAAFVQIFHNRFPLWYHCHREEIEAAKAEVLSEVASVDGVKRVSRGVLVDCLEYARHQ